LFWAQAMAIKKRRDGPNPIQKDIWLGMIRLYALFRTAMNPITSHQVAKELRLHGFTLSAETVGPILRGMEKRGYIASLRTTGDGPPRKLYSATTAGRQTIAQARSRLRAFLDLSE
jgi:DNA-binding PadR family transcriptional regulator